MQWWRKLISSRSHLDPGLPPHPHIPPSRIDKLGVVIRIQRPFLLGADALKHRSPPPHTHTHLSVDKLGVVARVRRRDAAFRLDNLCVISK